MYIFFLMSNKSDICMCIWCDVTLVTQSCPTLCDPMDCSLPGSSVLGIFQARTLEWLAIAFSRGCPQPRNWSRVSHSADTVFTIWASRQDCMCHTHAFNSQDKVNWKPQCTSMTVQRVLRIPGMKGVGARGLSAHGCLWLHAPNMPLANLWLPGPISVDSDLMWQGTCDNQPSFLVSTASIITWKFGKWRKGCYYSDSVTSSICYNSNRGTNSLFEIFSPYLHFIQHDSLYFIVSLSLLLLLSWFVFVTILLHHSWEFQVLFILFCTANSTLFNSCQRAAPVYFCICKLVRVGQIRSFNLTGVSLRLWPWIEFLLLKMSYPLLNHHKNLWGVTHNLLSGLLLLNWLFPNQLLPNWFLCLHSPLPIFSLLA